MGSRLVVHTSVIQYAAGINNGPAIIATCDDGSIWQCQYGASWVAENTPDAWLCIYQPSV